MTDTDKLLNRMRNRHARNVDFIKRSLLHLDAIEMAVSLNWGPHAVLKSAADARRNLELALRPIDVKNPARAASGRFIVRGNL